jgi:glycerol-3-phosphate acyltransferase PlsY
MDTSLTLLTALGAYLLGSVSFAVVVSRVMGLPDPRSYGSKNPGATNVLRSGSKAAALVTLLGDAAKGGVAVWAAQRILGADASVGIAAAALAVVLGHMYPVFHRFAGGKGVATSLGVMLALDWRVALGAVATFLILAAFFRYVSLGSIVGAVFAAFFTFFIYGSHPYSWAVLAIAVLTVWRHRGNITKLIAGTEGRLGAKKAG